RLLEADSKSMRSMNGSRRNSGSSLVSSSSASSNLSHLEEDTWILWGRIVNEWDEWRKKKEKLLKEELLMGFLLILRSKMGSFPPLSLTPNGFKLPSSHSTSPRDVPACPVSPHGKRLCIQGCQQRFKGKFVSFWVSRCLRKRPSAPFPASLPFSLSYIQEQLPELNIHFRSQSFLTSMYASSWFLTLFLTTFPLPVATRVFDIFMYEGLEIVFRVGMALLQFNQAELVQLDMEGMSQFFQKVIPHQFDSCPDKLILRAFQVKYNPKKMKRLEKEYAAIKNKEMEEQIEIK
ncbi:EVI5-like, partial [Colius striatus]